MIHCQNLVEGFPLLLILVEYSLVDLDLDYWIVVLELLLLMQAVLCVELLQEFGFRSLFLKVLLMVEVVG